MTVRNVTEAKAELSALLVLVEKGEDVIIARAGKPVARLTAVSQPGKPRRLGFLQGKIRISPDFDNEDKEIEDMFYGKPIDPPA